MPETELRQYSKVIREVHPDDKTDLSTVARLHMELLGFGPMAGLGERFIREICYAKPVADGLLRLALYELDGEPAGFVAYTAQSIGFHRHALKDHWLYAGWLTFYALIEKPLRLKALVRAIKVVLSRRSEQKTGSDPMGEVVCIAVLPKFLKNKFVRESGVLVSEDLVRYSAKYLQRAGVAEMRMLVDQDNKAPLFLYHRLGASFNEYEQAGEPMVQVWFDLISKPLVEVPSIPEAWATTEENEKSGQSENGWHDYWEEISHDKKFFRIEAADYVDRLFRYVQVSPDARVLDFGCGFGHVAEQLANRVGTVYLWDIAKSIRVTTRIRLAYLDNVEFADMTGATGELPESLDNILVHSVIQYKSLQELSESLDKWHGCLAEHGRLVISDIITPQSSAGDELLQYLLFSIRKGFFFDALVNGVKEFARYFRVRNNVSLLTFDRDTFRTLANDAGYQVEILDENLSYRNKRFTAVLTK